MSPLPSPAERKQSAGGIGRGNRWRTESRWNDVRTGLKVRKVMIDETTVDAWSSFRYSPGTAGRSIDASTERLPAIGSRHLSSLKKDGNRVYPTRARTYVHIV